MALQVYIDDSGDSSGIMVLAGFVGAERAWNEFCLHWAACCAEQRPISYFRANEARGLKKQFKNWTPQERDAKVSRLARVAWDHRARIGAIGVTTTRHLYREIMSPHMQKKFKDEPYYLLATTIWALCEQRLEKAGATHPTKVDFIFDDQGKVGTRLKRKYDDEIKPTRPLFGELSFANDRDRWPLQVADMFAWKLRNDVSQLAIPTTADTYLNDLGADIIHLNRDWLTGIPQASRAEMQKQK